MPPRQFAAAVAYLELNSRLSALPAVAVFVGIASFLFHARNTVPHHRLDLTGVALLAPAVFDTAVARVLPLDEARRPGAIVGIRVLLFTVPVVVVAVLHPTVPSWDPLWSITVRTAPTRPHTGPSGPHRPARRRHRSRTPCWRLPRTGTASGRRGRTRASGTPT
jgi:hypothetical protein